jgi:2-amino-4-hydroxy-6-hydroxymethyldihydropteridine diphosphokinase
MATLPQSHLLAFSGIYLSEPLEVNDSQPDYFNAACALETRLAPEALLAHLLAIEIEYGRERTGWHSARTLDLDLIAYEDVTMDTEHLQLPHPRAHTRAFVILPLCEIAPWVRLGTHGSVVEALAAVSGQRIRRIASL